MDDNELMAKVREAESALNRKQLEIKALPGRIQDCDSELKRLGDAQAIRACMRRKADLEQELEVENLILTSLAVALEESHAALHASYLKRNRVEVDEAWEAHQAAEEAVRQAQELEETAATRLRKAQHDVAQSERDLTTRQNNAANLRSGNMPVAA